LKINSFLAGTLALVLVAGMASPAFAQQPASLGSIQSNQIFVPQHGNADQSFTGPFSSVGAIEPNFIPSGQTFTPTVDNLVAVDVFFCDVTPAGAGTVDLTVNVWDSNTPGVGTLLGSSLVTVNELNILCSAQPSPVHFDFGTIPLVPGNTYALSFVQNLPTVGVQLGSDTYPGGMLWVGTPFPTFDFGFITYFDQVVGGESLPIDSTALLLAGAQTFSWMIPVVLSVLGIGLFVVSRKNE